MGHNYIGHNHMGHNYMGHNYIGHNYIGQTRLRRLGVHFGRADSDAAGTHSARARARGHTLRYGSLDSCIPVLLYPCIAVSLHSRIPPYLPVLL